MTRTVKAPDVRRSELIATAQQLFYSKGYALTSVNDIVKQVGVAKGTFYHYFDSKQAILEGLVDEIMAESVAIMQGIIADEALTALQKWSQAVIVLNDWKLERKEDILAIMRVMQQDKNVLLRHKIQTQTIRLLAPAYAQIITQGITEGVFETTFAQETAEIILTIVQTAREPIAEILLNPEQYEQPAVLIQRKFEAVTTAVERVLGAAPGSLSFVDPDLFKVWFKEPRDS